jgi:hypothetical protein
MVLVERGQSWSLLARLRRGNISHRHFQQHFHTLVITSHHPLQKKNEKNRHEQNHEQSKQEQTAKTDAQAGKTSLRS